MDMNSITFLSNESRIYTNQKFYTQEVVNKEY